MPRPPATGHGFRQAALAALLGIVTVIQVVHHYRDVVDHAERNALRRLQGIATTAAIAVDADQLQRILLRNREPDAIQKGNEDPDYDDVNDMLGSIERQNLLGRPIYTVHKSPDAAEPAFWVGVTSAEHPTFRVPYVALPQLANHYEHGGVLRADSNEGMLSAFSPVHNARGHVVGLVVADEPFKQTREEALVLFGRDSLLYLLILGALGWVGWASVNRGPSPDTENVHTHDPTTGLPNRSTLVRHLGTTIEMSAKKGSGEGAGVALVCVGLDHFRHLNAEAGPRAGDDALRILAHRLQGEAGSQSLVGRIAGDVFAVVQTGIMTSEDAATYARRLLQVFEEPLRLDEQTVTVRASVGVAMHPIHAPDSASLIEAAEEALALAKQRARGQVWVFDEEASVNVKQRKTLAKHLATAIERNEFFCVYQPKVNKDTKLTGAEALLRWRSPELGLVSPAQFIPIAESNGIIIPLTYWVVQNVCEQLRVWTNSQPHQPPIKIAVNLSLLMFRDPAMVDRLCEIITKAGIQPKLIELEITETGLMGNPEVTLAQLQALKQFGFRLSIDDFGTGYSSLGRLAQMPIDALKVDQSFVRGLDKQFSNAIMVRTIIQLAHSLDLEVVAEGVEEERHLAYLRELGCDQLQGYLFDKPLDADQFYGKWLRSDAPSNVIRLLGK